MAHLVGLHMVNFSHIDNHEQSPVLFNQVTIVYFAWLALLNFPLFLNYGAYQLTKPDYLHIFVFEAQNDVYL